MFCRICEKTAEYSRHSSCDQYLKTAVQEKVVKKQNEKTQKQNNTSNLLTLPNRQNYITHKLLLHCLQRKSYGF